VGSAVAAVNGNGRQRQRRRERPDGSGLPAGPVGTADSITVVP
jgi:hypothetical protein